MICYKDTTFCISPDCKHPEHKLTDLVKAQAKAWWGNDNAPIMVGYLCGGAPEGWPHNAGGDNASQ